MSDIEELISQFESMKSDFQEKFKVSIKETFIKIFDKNPDLVGFSFTAYTPYFNDGEPCEYGVNEATCKFTDTAADAGEHEDGYLYDWDVRDNPKQKKICKDINKLLQAIPEEMIEFTFGDHIRVTVTKEGIDVTDYSHD